jgi:pimeloyl-ACP methyl ester carboxylesterase
MRSIEPGISRFRVWFFHPGMTAVVGAQTFTRRDGQVLFAIEAFTNIHFGNVPMKSSAAKTFLVCHGAWSAGWAWKKMHPLMQSAGHRLVTPTYTGLGERVHLANPSIDLETHIQDVLNVIKYEDLGDIVLLGHSYGGMVATGVADRARDRITQLIYLDAFVPRDGQSLFDINEPGRQPMHDAAKKGDGWRVPPMTPPPDTSPADLEWLTARRVDMPIKCFETKLKLVVGELTLPRSYIYATRITPGDTFGQFARCARSEAGWRYHEIDASHSPNVTAPEALMALLKIIAN